MGDKFKLTPPPAVLGLSDCHKSVCSTLRASFKKLPPKIIKYADQKHFYYPNDSKLLQGDLYRNCDKPYEKRVKKGTPFMTKELSKAIMEKSKIRNKYLK